MSMTLKELKQIIREVVSFEFEPLYKRGGGKQTEPDQSGVVRTDHPQQGDTSGMWRQHGTYYDEPKKSPHIWFLEEDEDGEDGEDDKEEK